MCRIESIENLCRTITWLFYWQRGFLRRAVDRLHYAVIRPHIIENADVGMVHNAHRIEMGGDSKRKNRGASIPRKWIRKDRIESVEIPKAVDLAGVAGAPLEALGAAGVPEAAGVAEGDEVFHRMATSS
jgi:hypothetical protein